MSYLVLARKYRPKTFDEVVGQKHVTRTLANAFASGRVHHAFLFCGPRGVGKTTLARILGKALNCEQGPTATPCGECSACKTIANGTAVDYYEMDGASNRGIDAIRELTDAVRYQPAMLRKKVYVIDEVHMLTTEAFNALLKTLEEPPPHVCFVLATTEPHKIPNTILSRCQRYDFKLVPASQLIEHLTQIFDRESIEIDSGAVSLIARESGGSVRDSLSLCDQVISYVGAKGITEAAVAEVLGVADRTLTRTLVTALAEGNAGSALEAVASAIGRGVDEVQLARAIVRYLRDLAVMQVAPESDKLVDGSAEERADLASTAQAMDRSRLVQMFDRMVRACDDLGQTQQPRLILDLALIDVAALEPLMPLGDLLDRLGDLERRLGGGGGSGPAPRGSRPAGNAGGYAGRPAGAPGSGAMASTAPAPAAPAPVQAMTAAPAAPAPVQAMTAAPAAPAEPAAVPLPRRPEPQAAVSSPARAAAAPAAEALDSFDRPFDRDVPPPDDSDAPPDVLDHLQSEPPAIGRATAHAGAPSPMVPEGSPAPAVPEDILGEWEHVLEALDKAGKPMLARFYAHAKVLSWTEAHIELGMIDAFAGFADDDSSKDLREFLRQRYGRSLALKMRVLTDQEAASLPEARSIEDRNRERADEERRSREREVRKHPVYNKVLETFGMPIREEINVNV